MLFDIEKRQMCTRAHVCIMHDNMTHLSSLVSILNFKCGSNYLWRVICLTIISPVTPGSTTSDPTNPDYPGVRYFWPNPGNPVWPHNGFHGLEKYVVISGVLDLIDSVLLITMPISS